METRVSIEELAITPAPGAGYLQVSARLQHRNDKGLEELNVSVRLPVGDRSLSELQRELLGRARLLLEAFGDELPLGRPKQLHAWEKLAE